MFSLSIEALSIIIPAFFFVCICAIGLFVSRSLGHNQAISKRLAGAPGEKTRSSGDNTLRASKAMIARFGQHLTLPDAKEITRIRFKLAQAGYYNAKTVSTFYAIRVASLFIPLFLLMVYWMLFDPGMETKTLVIRAAFAIIIGLMAPDFVLNRRIKKRQLLAREGFPDMMDLLVSCIEAGLGLDAALSNVAKELGKRFPVIQVNLDLLNLELMAGRKRHEAFKNFGERLGLEEAKSLNIMLKQSEEMGSSLGASLRTFSEEMRTKRMLRAEEKAMSLPAKLTIPLILFIFPTIMAMLFLPAAARLSGVF